MKLDGFIGPTYTLEHPSAACQRLVNLYLETQEGGPRKGNAGRFVGTPGLRKRATLGGGPIRGVHWASTGQLFVVSGAGLWEVTSDWSASQRVGALNSPSGRVTMVDDGTRLVIGDGGETAYNTLLASGSTLTAVADADCPGGFISWQDGYFLHTVPGTGRWQISGLNAVTYDALDVATAEGRPDNLAMILSVNRLVWLFGDQTTEVWWNSGNPDFPFQRNETAFIETGTIAAGTCARVGGSVAWVGNDERGRGTVWHAQGLQPVRISTHAVELALSGYANLDEAYAFAYQQRGHEFYQLSVPASDTDSGGTWVYDFATGQWHERSYLGTDGEEPHRASCGTVAFGEVVVGDREDGRLYTYDLTYYTDDGDPIRRVRQSPHLSQGEKRIRFNSFELQVEPGVGLEATPTTQAWAPDTTYATGALVTNYGNTYVAATGGHSVQPQSAWAPLTAYSFGDFRVNGQNVYRCTSGGTSGGSVGPTGTGTGIVDGTATWDFTSTYGPAGESNGQADGTPFHGAGVVWNFVPMTLADPIALLSWSDDGGHTWSNEHEASMGKVGEYKTRVKWRRLGAARDRVFRVATSEPVPVTWLGAEIDAVQLGS